MVSLKGRSSKGRKRRRRGRVRAVGWPLLLTALTGYFGINAFSDSPVASQSQVLFYLFLVLLILTVVFTQGSDEGPNGD